MTLTVEHHDPSNHGSVIENGTTVFTGPLSDCWAYVQIKERENLLTIIDRLETSLEEIAGLPIDPDDPLVTTRKMVKIAMDAYDRARQPDPLETPDSTEVVGPDWSQAPDNAKAWAVDGDGKAHWFEEAVLILGSDEWNQPSALSRIWDAGYYPNHPNWRESLTKRPEVEVKGDDSTYLLERYLEKPLFQDLAHACGVIIAEGERHNTAKEIEYLLEAVYQDAYQRGLYELKCRKPSDAQTQAKAEDADTGSEVLGVPDRPAATLRDRFAMAALTGLISSPNWGANLSATVADAYKFADALLADRDQGGE